MKRERARGEGNPRVLEPEGIEQRGHDLIAHPQHDLVLAGIEILLPVEVFDRKTPRRELGIRRDASHIHDSEVRGHLVVADRPTAEHAKDEGAFIVFPPVEQGPLGQEPPPITCGGVVGGVREHLRGRLVQQYLHVDPTELLFSMHETRTPSS